MTFVNGPINTCRMEGKIFGMTKVLYIFMDYHKNISEQSQCDNIDSIDIDKYIINECSNSTEKYDFFLEIYKSQLKSDMTKNRKGRYIDNAMRFFNIESKNKIKKLSNMRYHYIDVREDINYYKIDDIITNFINLINAINNDLHLYKSDYDSFLSYILDISKELLLLYNLFYNIK